ncbi:TerB family tellurite resistance protein [Galbibacter sp. EGI 63066]|uniref:TerB family tellurite resistance protein n=1 Tax=Galbibacter sp. EGI 63066 TaxID=2993559 RepID=UPI0022494B9F|nr:TerB family tellurite resistance protein [Galbibacter sp. EGI 63066]MCX2681091.1 TerB family tellurite resistance protein [Galbibacter sp. EGI 63066]
MSISDLYSSGFRERNRDHFASIVRVALTDGEINDEEKAFLDRLANNLDISKEDYEAVLENPTAYKINPPVLYDARLERLYDIGRMVYADHIADDHEMRIMIRMAIGLGFTSANAEFIVKKAMYLLNIGVDLETFIEEIKHMNR